MIARGSRRGRLSSSNGQDAGNADKMGISGFAIWRLTLKWL